MKRKYSDGRRKGHSVSVTYTAAEIRAVLKHAREGEPQAVTVHRLSLMAAGHELSTRLPAWLTPEVRERFGVDSNRAISRDCGVSDSTVRVWRAKLEGA